MPRKVVPLAQAEPDGTDMLKLFEWLKRRYAAGDRTALAECILICAMSATPLPTWAREIWQSAMGNLSSGALDSWDSVLGHVRTRTEGQRRLKQRELAERRRVISAAGAIGDALPIKRGDPAGSFFAVIGRNLNMDPGAARKLFYRIPREVRALVRR